MSLKAGQPTLRMIGQRLELSYEGRVVSTMMTKQHIHEPIAVIPTMILKRLRSIILYSLLSYVIGHVTYKFINCQLGSQFRTDEPLEDFKSCFNSNDPEFKYLSNRDCSHREVEKSALVEN